MNKQRRIHYASETLQDAWRCEDCANKIHFYDTQLKKCLLARSPRGIGYSDTEESNISDQLRSFEQLWQRSFEHEWKSVVQELKILRSPTKLVKITYSIEVLSERTQKLLQRFFLLNFERLLLIHNDKPSNVLLKENNDPQFLERVRAALEDEFAFQVHILKEEILSFNVESGGLFTKFPQFFNVDKTIVSGFVPLTPRVLLSFDSEYVKNVDWGLLLFRKRSVGHFSDVPRL